MTNKKIFYVIIVPSCVVLSLLFVIPLPVEFNDEIWSLKNDDSNCKENCYEKFSLRPPVQPTVDLCGHRLDDILLMHCFRSNISAEASFPQQVHVTIMGMLVTNQCAEQNLDNRYILLPDNSTRQIIEPHVQFACGLRHMLLDG